jgi:molybdenum ABC transporter molybdate-binding protein
MLRFPQKPNLFFMLAVLCWMTTAVQAAPEPSQEISAITILADPALAAPLTQLASDYTRDNHISVSVSFLPSLEQNMAIEAGETADLFISAHPTLFAKLIQKKVLTKDSTTPLVSTRLMLVSSAIQTRPVAALDIKTFNQWRKDKNFLLVVANPSAAAEGFYAEQVLRYLRKRIFLSDAVVQMQNTSDIVDFLAFTEGLGVMFESDALQSESLSLIGKVPDEWYQKPTFTAAVLTAGSKQKTQKFLAYLQSNHAQRVFLKNGLYAAMPN